MIKFYGYKNCDSCRKAKKTLMNASVEFEDIDILTNPPSKKELESMLSFYEGDLKKLFNTSGKAYRENNYKDKIKKISKEDALNDLTSDGYLVKRPFILAKSFGMVGFKEEDLKKQLSK